MRVDQSLWERLEGFTFDDETAVLSFTDRLMRENGWTGTFTERVVDEHGRFLYLTQVADGPMTPSEAVDQVWHLHLTYTRSYWDDLCGKVLRRPLHHNPAQGGPEEEQRYREQYAATLEAYRVVFGKPPSAEIWPDVETRFRRPSRMQFVDTSTVWLVSKRPLAGLLTFLRAVIGCTMAGAFVTFGVAEQKDVKTLAWVAWMLGLFALCATDPAGGRRTKKGGGGGGMREWLRWLRWLI